MLAIVPQDADHETPVVAENCRASLTTTVGLIGAIVNAEDEAVDPERVVFCGLLVPVSVKARVAVKVPDAVGLNTILAVQLAEAARLVPHVLLEIAKAAALAPEIAILLTVMAALLPLLSVTD